MLLLCAVLGVVGVLTAASAPYPRGPWFQGWHKPGDPGDGSFHRKGDKLTITVQGEGNKLAELMRDLDGDFLMEVRVNGNFHLPGDGFRRAGIRFVVDENHVTFTRGARESPFPPAEERWTCHSLDGEFWNKGMGHGRASSDGSLSPRDRCMFLSLQRKGQAVLLRASADGKDWRKVMEVADFFPLPEKVKVGVFAQGTAGGVFKAEFDQFKLTLLKK